MEKGKEIPLHIKRLIIKLRDEGKSLRQIGKIVDKPHSSIQRVIQNFLDTGSLSARPRCGRPKKLSVREERKIIRKIKVNPKLSASNIAADLNATCNKRICPETVRNVLRTAGYHGRIARRKPYISKINRKKRIEFAKSHLNKSPEFWNKIIWSDESKFTIFKLNGRCIVWRKPNTEFDVKNLRPTVKHGGGGVMVWGCMSSNGVGNLHIIDRIMDRFVYLDILKKF